MHRQSFFGVSLRINPFSDTLVQKNAIFTSRNGLNLKCQYSFGINEKFPVYSFWFHLPSNHRSPVTEKRGFVLEKRLKFGVQAHFWNIREILPSTRFDFIFLAIADRWKKLLVTIITNRV